MKKLIIWWYSWKGKVRSPRQKFSTEHVCIDFDMNGEPILRYNGKMVPIKNQVMRDVLIRYYLEEWVKKIDTSITEMKEYVDNNKEYLSTCTLTYIIQYGQ